MSAVVRTAAKKRKTKKKNDLSLFPLFSLQPKEVRTKGLFSHQLRDDLVDAPPLLIPRHPLRQLELGRRHDRLAHGGGRQQNVALPDDGRGGAELACDDGAAVDVDGAVDLATGDVPGEDLEEGGLWIFF